VIVAAAALASCGGTTVTGTEADPAGTNPSTTAATDSGACDDVNLTASDVGVTETTITITVIADTGSPIKPGLFQGSVDAINAWAAYVNDHGGLACRQVVVKTADSKISPDEARNAASTACEDSFALVGTTAIFFQDVSPLKNCKDRQGAASGLPDLPVLQTESAHQCSEYSYAVLPIPGSCPYSGSGPRTFEYSPVPNDFYLEHVSKDLHGVHVIPRDLPSTIAVATPLIANAEKMGITTDAQIGMSAIAVQSAYMSVAQAIKDHESTFVRNSLDYTGIVMMRKEAYAQGVSSVKVWDCSLQCYDQRLISTGGSAVEGQYVWLQFLPLEDVNENEQLQALFEYEQKQNHVPDAFGEMAWLSGQLFAQAIDDIVASHGLNAITRANLLEAVRNIHDFTGGGLAPPTDIGNKTMSPCSVGMQVRDGEFVRVHPTTPGEFACGDNEIVTVVVDPVKAFTG
jgi:hypothetical protein